MQPIRFDDTAIAFASKDDRELRRARWLFRVMGNAAVADIGAHFTRLAFQVGLPVRGLVRNTIYRQFCGGEDLHETEETVHRLAESGVSTILDYGVEAKQSEEEFEANLDEQLRAIAFADDHEMVPYVSCKVTGYAPFALLERVNSGDALPDADAAAVARLQRRLHRIAEVAATLDVALYVDAEESWIQDGIDRLVTELMARWNTDRAVIFNTVQLYRHDRLAFLEASHRAAVEGGYVLGVKLVRGAYMDKERERAARLSIPSPIHADKASVDHDYDAALRFCLDHIDTIAFCAATHNEASCALLVEEAGRRGIPLSHPHLHFAQLYGMSDHISFNLARAGCNASKYVPYGPVQEVVPYLIRRAQENRAVAGQMSRELRLLEQEVRRREGRSTPR